MFDLASLISSVGTAGIVAIVFAETGLFFGFFLPGDSLLFTAGFLASQGVLSIVPLIVLTTIAAIVGDTVGYIFGKRVGPMIFTRKESRFFKPSHVQRAHVFFMKHGNKAVFFARFLPIVRTFVPIIAGVAGMPYRQFMVYNVIGGITWVWSMTLLGYTLGKQVEDAERYLYPLIIAIIILSFIPVAYEWYRERADKKK